MAVFRAALFLSVVCAIASASLSFVVVGDWGGSPVFPYTLPGQVAAAKGMGTVAEQIGSSFTLALGDNFYSSGVQDVDSSRFEKTWDTVYSASSLQNKWYVIAGNHDHKGNVSAQIEFTKEDPSKRWTFPSPYHAHSFKGTDGVTVDIILIDTVDLCSMSAVQDEGAEGYFAPLAPKPKADASTQWTWIESQLSKSTADFVLVGGHYPVFSVCEHGPTQTLIDHLEPLLVKYGAHYLSGHDHCFNHFVVGAEKVRDQSPPPPPNRLYVSRV